MQSIKHQLRESLSKYERYYLSPDISRCYVSVIDIDDIKTWNDLATYNAQITVLNNLYYNYVLNEDFAYDLMGSESLEAAGIKEYPEDLIEEKLEALPYEDDILDYNIDDYLETSDIPSNISLEEMIKMAHPPTDSIKSAGYIMRDGILLDFNRPYIDHRELNICVNEDDYDSTQKMYGFMDTTGAIRIGGNSGTAEIRRRPTDDQMKKLRTFFTVNRPDYYVDYLDENKYHHLSASSVELIMLKIGKLQDPIMYEDENELDYE